MGRYKLNKRLRLDVPLDTRVLTNEDLVQIVAHMIELNNAEYAGKGPRPTTLTTWATAACAPWAS